MKLNLYKITFVAIVFLSALLRLYELGGVPSSLNWDEVSLGYNAYSIMSTGRDEYGSFLPVILRSYDDYKPAAYSYLVIPFIQVFGLVSYAVRLPSALLGIVTVICTYFLVKEIFGLSSKFKDTKYSEYLALTATFLLAISPWHIQFSRIAFESNVGVALNVLSLLFFLKGLKKPIYLILAFSFGALNIHMYQSEKVFTPLVLLALTVIFVKQILQNKYYYLVGVAVAFIITLPFIYYTLTNPNTLLRAKGVSVFSDQTQFLQRNVAKLTNDQESGKVYGMLIDNRRIEYAKAIFNGYISHFDLNWLFISGDIARHHAPDMGLLYIAELPFLFIGIYKLLFGEFSLKSKLVIFSYFLIVPIPASITSGVPHAVRTLNFLPIIQIFVAIGIIDAFRYASNIKFHFSGGRKLINLRILNYKYIIFALFILFFSFNFLYFLNQYFVQQNYYHSKEWLYGYEQAIDFIKPIQGDYSQIIVSNTASLDQSYMFFLFYLKFDPYEYQKSGGTISGGFAQEHKGFSNFSFRPIKWDTEEKNSSVLFIGPPSDFPEEISTYKTIFYPDGTPAIKIVKG